MGRTDEYDGSASTDDPIDDDRRGRRAAERERDEAQRNERSANRHERLDLLREAAYQAEYATGEREDSEEQARRHIIIRVGTIVIGSIVLLIGLAMLVLPGQGILVTLAGLGILSRELPWAERMVEYVKKRAKIEQLKQQPKWVQVLMWGFTIAAATGSLVYFATLR